MRNLVIAPYDSRDAQLFDQAWAFDRTNGTIALGWTELGDISGLDRDALEAHFKATYPNKTRGVQTREINMLWSFYHETDMGDRIIARRGRTKIVGIGTVEGAPFHDSEKGRARVSTGHLYANFLPVKWDVREIDFGKMVFPIGTMYTIDNDKFDSLTSGGAAPEIEPDVIAAVQTLEAIEFALEDHLENFMVKNFDQIFGSSLKLFVDEDGQVGQQYSTTDDEGVEIGRIDLLATDPASGDLVVIELKKGRESDKVIGQILRYISWVKDNLCKPEQDVRGIVICSRADKKLRAAIKPVSNLIQAKEYVVDFKLTEPP
jgi:restriction system protein